MGLIKGGMSYTHFFLDALADGERVKDRLIEQLNLYGFERNKKLCAPSQKIGWVTTENPLDAEFEFSKVVHTNFISFAFREDFKRIPSGTFRILAQQELLKYQEETGKARLNKRERDEVKQALEERLLLQALPDIKVYELLWFHQKGEILFFGSSAAVVERFRKLFRHSLERELLKKNHFTAVQRLELPKDIESQLVSLSPTRSLSVGDQGADFDEEWEDGSGDSN